MTAKIHVVLPLLAVLACSSTDDPRAPVTLLVEHPACDSGPCAPIQVLAFPSNRPTTPGGLWSIDLGTLTTRSGCFLFPRSAEFTVSGPSGVEKVYKWTVSDRVAIGTVIPPNGRLQASPSTGEFVPSDQAGWKVALPSGAGLTGTLACTP